MQFTLFLNLELVAFIIPSKKMTKQIFACLLILFGIFSQGIGIFSDSNIEKTSNLLRTKRFFSNAPSGSDYRVPYIVYVQKHGHNECLGSILTSQIIITTASCVHEENGIYDVLTATSETGVRRIHNVTRRILFPQYNPQTFANDLALLLITPSIKETRNHERILLYKATLLQNAIFTLTGWGHIGNTLRSVHMVQLKLRECQQYFNGIREITDRNICTIDKERQSIGGKGDSGGPLVVRGKLIGVYFWTGRFRDRENANPDVFLNLQHSAYANWIQANVMLNHGWYGLLRNPI